ncbi:MAG: RNA 2',3'-cyclic phosphodiesterase [Candidatus Omnitrophota bacterium]
MHDTIRTFIAIELTKELQEELKDLQQELKKSNIDATWVRPENIHLTLKFLGNITTPRIEQIGSILEDTAKQRKAFYVGLSGIGAFPKLEYPRVVWVGINEGKQETAELAKSLEDKLGEIGFQKENRPFSSHLTLARIRNPHNKDKLKKIVEGISFTSKNKAYINKIILFKSTLTPQGSIYSKIYQSDFISAV